MHKNKIMTKEDKELLLKDLSARLPYHVRCKIWLKDGTTEEGSLDLEHNYGDVLQHAFYYNDIKDIKPYLRPMSSMTEEERKIYAKLLFADLGGVYEDYYKALDYLNSLHIDYRGLIEKGLALEALEGMYVFH